MVQSREIFLGWLIHPKSVNPSLSSIGSCFDPYLEAILLGEFPLLRQPLVTDIFVVFSYIILCHLVHKMH